MKTFTYHGKKVILKAETYSSNNTLAVAMCDKNGEILDIITTNLTDGMANSSMAYLDTNNYPDIAKWMEKNNLALPMYYEGRSGFCSYPLYTILTSEF